MDNIEEKASQEIFRVFMAEHWVRFYFAMENEGVVVLDVPAEAIAVAWITRHPAHTQVVLGTTSPERVTASARGADVTLTRPEWYELFRAAGYRVP